MKRIILLAMIIAIATPNLEAQKLKNYLKKKQKVVERELDRKADQKIREGVDGIFKKKKPKPNGDKPATKKDGKDKSTNTTDNITTVYNFALNIQYDMNIYDANGKIEYEQSYTKMLTDNSNYTASKVKNSERAGVIIVDYENERQISFDNGSKKAKAIALSQTEETLDDNKTSGKTSDKTTDRGTTTGGTTSGTTDDENVDNFKKTIETTKIAGYTCTKYIWKTEDGSKGEMWINDADYDLQKAFSNGEESMTELELPKETPKTGLLLKLKMIDKSGAILEVKATKAKKKSSKYDMSTYEF
jgi:hypothetical protein